MADRAATTVNESIAEVFRRMVGDAQLVVDEQRIPSVDLELTFRAVTVDRGIPIFSRKQEQNSLEIKIATRLVAAKF